MSSEHYMTENLHKDAVVALHFEYKFNFLVSFIFHTLKKQKDTSFCKSVWTLEAKKCTLLFIKKMENLNSAI